MFRGVQNFCSGGYRMYTSVSLVALSGFLLVSPAEGPTWTRDYNAARKVGRQEQKPLAVFVGSGQAGYQKVSRTGRLTKQAQSLLAKGYVCVYVDVRTSAGKRLARDLGIKKMGIVLSDRTGNLQAFRHEG